jgi:predicted N-acetyltransferase YhbS
MSGAALGPPEKFSSEFDLSDFDSGEAALDDWLRRRAARDEASGASRTYVVRAGMKVVGYYSLAVGAVSHEAAPARLRRNMPDPLPVMILGCLAVNKRFQGQGVGVGLLRDAVLRTVQAGEIAGIRGIVVHAISTSAKRFYEAFGFMASPVGPLTVMTTLAEVERILSGKRPR